MELECSLKNGVLINCSWVVDSGCQDLKNAVKFSSKHSYDLEDVVQVESCVHLSFTGPKAVPCKIYVKLDKKSQFVITRIDTVSEARIIECYGNYEEYTNTVHAEHMDDFEGCSVYSASSMLPPTQEVTLKFARMKNENSMWLYGLMFTVKQIALPEVKIAGINLSNVNSILKESSRPISEKAEHCKKLLQQCGSSIDNSGAIDPHVLIKMFEGEYLKPLGETSRSMSKCLMRLIPFVMNKAEQQTLVSTGSDNIYKDTEQTVTATVTTSPNLINNHKNNNVHIISNGNIDDYIKIMKDYIDKRINDMEEMLTNKLEKRLNDIEIAQNSKLDAIMKLLEQK
ncbi:uncharacterized protein LOC142321637 [Lycorma delicatula]|uniref:uncharacterized protein LOC142321637 n=1 Tax=Lycorma delicatula TaxID=130591 RepID=UPI003F51A51D